ncbi:MAG: hypothetical protein NXI31_04425 [bacterium]|nr:hypothetical protein [bacterium]
MEGTVFRDPAVADLMKKHFVEARLHVDSQSYLTDAQWAANQKARDEIGEGTLTLPFYVVVDPKTGESVAEHTLSGAATEWTAGWLDFLGFALDEAGRPR